MEVTRYRILTAFTVITTIYIVCGTVSVKEWSESTADINSVFTGTRNILFNETTYSLVYCAAACNDCVAFSFTSPSKRCIGYTALDDAVAMDNTRLWKKTSCALVHLGYVYDSGLDACVKLYVESRRWGGALSKCQQDTATLLIIDTPAKLASVVTGQHKHTFTALRYFWLGGTDHNTGSADDWRWTNGDSIDSSLWKPGEPNNPTENCVSLYVDQGVCGCEGVATVWGYLDSTLEGDSACPWIVWQKFTL